MSIWTATLQLFKDDVLDSTKVETLISAAVAAYHDVQSSGDASIGAVVRSIEANSPDALPIIEQVANVLYPGSGNAIEITAFLLSFSHKMTPEEEAQWMDRASNPNAGGG